MLKNGRGAKTAVRENHGSNFIDDLACNEMLVDRNAENAEERRTRRRKERDGGSHAPATPNLGAFALINPRNAPLRQAYK